METPSLTPAERGNLLLETLFTDNWALLAQLYDGRNNLPANDIYIAAAVGNTVAVESLLAADRAWARRAGGPLQTRAITYAAFGRFSLLDATYPARQQQIVRLLLANGADPNSFVREAERGKQREGRLSALYGCCRRPGNPPVAKLLLDAGANTDDGESVYHASELADTACLELLFAAGVTEKDREWCIRRALDAENPEAVALYMRHGTDPNHLHWALFRDRSLAVIQLLVQHGAKVDAICEKHWLLGRIEGLTPVQVAERINAAPIVTYLLASGATDNRTPADRLIGACWREDADAVHSILQAHPDLVSSLTARDHANIATFARAGRVKAVQLMLDAGFNIEARADDLDATPLLYAATTGDAAMVELLIARGARLDVAHKYGGTPVRTAVYCAVHSNSGRGEYAQAIRLLLEAGDTARKADLELAREHHLDDVADILQAHGASL